MGSLRHRKIDESYADLLHISNNNNGVDSTVRKIEDGGGTTTPLGLSDTTIQISGHIIPETNSTYDIGSAEYKIRHLYLSNSTIYTDTGVLNINTTSGDSPDSLISKTVLKDIMSTCDTFDQFKQAILNL